MRIAQCIGRASGSCPYDNPATEGRRCSNCASWQRTYERKAARVVALRPGIEVR